ncbi:MAG: PAS sensor protein, partial [Deltaproteobacteria bacterium]|nr:PAS sensor protein [Deltaproteobacteria bacterium]
MLDSGLEEPDFFTVPGMWRGNTAKGIPLSAHGCGTYGLRVRLPEAMREHGPPMALLVTGLLSVGEVQVNGVVVASGGLVGTVTDPGNPSAHLLSPRFSSQDADLKIVLRVSNHLNVQGGINSSIFLGTEE